MDSNGIATLDLIFTIFLMMIITITSLNLIEERLNMEKNIDEHVQGRLLIEKVANIINQVNINGNGYSTKINLPQNIQNNSYSILVKSDEIILEFNNKKGKSTILPLKLEDSNNLMINEIKIYGGNSYLFKKSLNDNNISSIKIYKI